MAADSTDRGVLAVDFGTANTYYCKCPADQVTPVGVDFGDGRDGLATAILYRETREPLLGNEALEEYGEATPAEQKRYSLRAQFKPDIATSELARRSAIDFLKGVLDLAQRHRVSLDPAHRHVIFGVPSEAGDEFRKAITQIAADAGYGRIRAIDEPKGALLYHVSHKDIPARDALAGILVVDFGGGTCDFAYMYRGEVRHSWGDMHLGGRLFDDLFFQWFVEQNPKALPRLREEGSEYFVNVYICREVKEFFSRTMARDRNEVVHKAVRHHGRIEGMTWDAFLARARNYTPSDTLRNYLSSIGVNGGCGTVVPYPLPSALGQRRQGEGTSVRPVAPRPPQDSPSPQPSPWSTGAREQEIGTIDLVAWFTDTLSRGLKEGEIRPADIQYALLAGGSSQWPFVDEIVRNELSLPAERVMRSDRPYTVISEGLSILPALQRRCEIAQKILRERFPQFCDQQLKPLIESRARGLATQIADAVAAELFDEKLKPVFLDFRENGGSVASLKRRLSASAEGFEPRVKELVDVKLATFGTGLSAAAQELMAGWFEEHGLKWRQSAVRVDARAAQAADMPDIQIPDLYAEIETAIGVISIGIISAITAMICGGAKMALIASGPVGLAIGALLGVVIGAIAVIYGLDRAREMAEEWEGTPKLLIRRVLSDKKIAQTRADLVTQLTTSIAAQLSKLHEELERRVKEQVQREIDALSEINQM